MKNKKNVTFEKIGKMTFPFAQKRKREKNFNHSLAEFMESAILACPWSPMAKYIIASPLYQTFSSPKWTGARQNLHYDLCAENTQISLGICPVWAVFDVHMKKPLVYSYQLSAPWRLITLCGCACWSESSLGARVIVGFAVLQFK